MSDSLLGRSRLAIALAIASASNAASASEVQALLRRADAFRLDPGAAQVSVSVEAYEDGKLDKERAYLVFWRPGRRSLVLSRSPVEKGQKVLMLGDDFWIVLPSSQRPIRITPAQKLLGDAAAGDVATMTWAEDYDGTIAGQVEVEEVPCVRLDLEAQRRGVTYRRLELYLARVDARPVQADLYVASEKLAKRATFEMGTIEGRRRVTAMRLLDRIRAGRETVIRYLARSARSLGDEYYNPMFLTRHDPD
jgi:Outer membrane lipoprotein-sorting protein